MASKRPGPRAFGWPGDTGSRTTGGPSEEIKSSSRWNIRKGPGAARQLPRAIPQPSLSSRLPQSLPHRRPSDDQSEQPRLGQPPRIRNSVGSVNSLVVGESSGPSSSVSVSSKLPGPSLKPRNVLRRKRSGLSQDTSSTRNDSRNDSTGASSSDSNPRSQTPLDAAVQLDRELTQSPMEIRVAQQVEIPRTKAQAVTIYPELDRYRDVRQPPRDESPGSNVPYRIATHDLPPPTPLFSGTSSQMSAFSGSPSTGWSGSPGPGPYSRDTTPTSMSSQSPGLVVPLRIPPSGARILRQADPGLTRPPVTRRRTGSISNDVGSVSADPQGLAAVRELSTSSSSNSTVRATGNPREKKKSKRPPPTSPSPPPRKSSQKSQGSRDESISQSKPPGETVQPQGTSLLPTNTTPYSRPRPAQVAQPTPSPKPTAPVRPSRDGTPDLQAQPIPVIQSNLSTTSLAERRRSSLLAPGPANRSVPASSLPDRTSHFSKRPPTREPTPAPRSGASGEVTEASSQESGGGTRAPSPGVSTFKTRFPLFGRRTKTTPEPSQQDKKDKPARKGPAAGTGHEGYGRLGSVRRRSNSVTNTSRVIPGTMSSQESLSSNQSYDPFLMERMAPVIIAGGEIVENRNTSSELSRTESNQSSTLRRPSIESRNSSQMSLSSRDAPRNTLWPSPFPRDALQSPSLSSRRPSESSEHGASKPTLALRRSMQRLKSGEQEPPKLLAPIVTRPQVVSPPMTSLDASIRSDDSIFDPSAEPAVSNKEAAGTTGLFGSRKLIKRARSPRKWNLFGRSQSQPGTEKGETAKTVAATVKAVQSKPVAFYTIMDSSEQDDAETLDLEEVLREARAMDETPDQLPVEEAESRRPSVTQDSVLAEPPRLQPGTHQRRPSNSKRIVTAPTKLLTPSVSSQAPAPVAAMQPVNPPRQAPARPSRLPQVGRIPKVVSARAEQTSPKSFSRPFHRLSVQMPPVRPAIQDKDSVAKGPSPPKPSTPEPMYEHPVTGFDSNVSALIYGVPKLSPPVSSELEREFLAFSPRKGSQCTTTTSSSSSGGLFTYADATAIVPEPNAPLAEDEIWDEYNDLLGEDTVRLPTTEAPSWPKPLRLGSPAQGNGKLIIPAMESPTLSPPPLPSLVQTLRSEMEQPLSSVCGTEIAEEVKRMLDNNPIPETLVAVPDPTSGQNEQLYGFDVVNQVEEPEPVNGDRAPPPGQQARRSDASGSSQGSEDSSPLSQVNLRVGSMTVSKWLTFGHVLFSPVRDELVSVVGSLKRPSILVVDGLGNDDWSFYAAETYPAATFFNLSPRVPIPVEHRNASSFPLTPPNHHQIQYLSHTDKFPFGAQSFTAVVFRFPAAAPESHYRNIISEARRVLKPGGFIELSILDVDLNNMGNRGRRTVRRLKERINSRAPDISLAPASDLILRLIGRRGFTDIKTCRVGVPVASIIARSSCSSDAGANGKRTSTNTVASPSKPKKDERSLPEMIGDESPVADESITKSVAKVGRWWYTRCYEGAAVPNVGPGSRSSIWRDKALLAECEEWGTSLKLMVCHARVPDGRARVASI
ncbi:Methyltransferase type 11 domain-containing protein [Madurella fahalii]|uniref:Methyltransferase type 11 domain-containing protein n=1 Tax=Madurella fahalii TaxID=1157608 RepID=A0ABQ0GAU8_9PEZI